MRVFDSTQHHGTLDAARQQLSGTTAAAHLCCHGVPVYDRLVLDASSPVCIAQRVEGLLPVDVCRADTGNHDRATVATQGVLQQSRQLRIPAEDQQQAARGILALLGLGLELVEIG